MLVVEGEEVGQTPSLARLLASLGVREKGGGMDPKPLPQHGWCLVKLPWLREGGIKSKKALGNEIR